MYRMDNTYVQKVKEWVSLDNHVLHGNEGIKHIKDNMQDIVDKKRELEVDIVDYIEKNKYEKLTLNIGDGTIKFGKKTSVPPISLKLVKIILEKYSNENPSEHLNITKIGDFLVDNLERKTSVYIRRELKI